MFHFFCVNNSNYQAKFNYYYGMFLINLVKYSSIFNSFEMFMLLFFNLSFFLNRKDYDYCSEHYCIYNYFQNYSYYVHDTHSTEISQMNIPLKCSIQTIYSYYQQASNYQQVVTNLPKMETYFSQINQLWTLEQEGSYFKWRKYLLGFHCLSQLIILMQMFLKHSIIFEVIYLCISLTLPTIQHYLFFYFKLIVILFPILFLFLNQILLYYVIKHKYSKGLSFFNFIYFFSAIFIILFFVVIFAKPQYTIVLFLSILVLIYYLSKCLQTYLFCSQVDQYLFTSIQQYIKLFDIFWLFKSILNQLAILVSFNAWHIILQYFYTKNLWNLLNFLNVINYYKARISMLKAIILQFELINFYLLLFHDYFLTVLFYSSLLFNDSYFFLLNYFEKFCVMNFWQILLLFIIVQEKIVIYYTKLLSQMIIHKCLKFYQNQLSE